jgi:uncharacterized protein involved in exopolysaccharide biosynthesis
MKRYVATFLRHKRLYIPVLLVMLVASGVGAYYYSVTTYEARTRIWVDKPVLSNLLDQNVQTYGVTPSAAQTEANKLSQLVQADSFMASVIEGTVAAQDLTGAPDHDREVIDKIRSKIAVSVPGPNTLTVLFRDKNPLLCQQIVQATVDKFENWNLQAQIDQSSIQLQFYQKQLDIYDERVKDIQHSLDDFYQQYPRPEPGSPQHIELERIQRELEAARSVYAAAAAKIAQAGYLDTLTQNNHESQFQLMDKATVPEEPAVTLAAAVRFFGVGVGASIGALLAMVAAVTWLDPAIRSAEDLERLGQIQVLGVVPDLKHAASTGGGPSSAGGSATSPTADLLAIERSFHRQWAGRPSD